MWYSKYNSISLSNFSPTVKVNILYYNDVTPESIAEEVDVAAENLNSPEFLAYVQSKVDTLNAKQAQVDAVADINVLSTQAIGAAPVIAKSVGTPIAP